MQLFENYNRKKIDILWFVLFIAALALPNIFLSFTEPMSAWARIANIVLPLGIYWLSVTLGCRRKWWSLIWLVWVFLDAFQLVLLALFGNSIIAVDMWLNLVTTNSSEASEMLSSISYWVIAVIALYLPLLVWGWGIAFKGHGFNPQFLKRQYAWGGSTLAAGCVLCGASYAASPDYAIQDDLFPANVLNNVHLAAERSRKVKHYAETSAGFTFNASSTRPSELPEVHVLVIGETARANNFGLYGYELDTTPLLSKTPGLVPFTRAMSQSNTTHKSVPMLLTAVDADSFEEIYKQKSLITAFKEAGYRTLFLSNQKYSGGLIDLLADEADEVNVINQDPKIPNNHDRELLPHITKAVAQNKGKLLIVCHTYGSHYKYRERYPESACHFKPDFPADGTAKNKEALMAAYNNTIRYTDGFLHDLIAILRGNGAAASMLYVSDHGEDIFDDDRLRFVHASPRPTFHQLHVPFLVWTSDSLRSAEPELARTLYANRDMELESSSSTFHTMLTLGGIATPSYVAARSAADPAMQNPERKYLDDHNQAVPLGCMLADKEDRLLMIRHQIH